jgi:tetratricopeptide (TPR) repeat protein
LDVGILKPWVTKLLQNLSHDRTAKLCVISTGQVYVRELIAFDNVLQFPVTELGDPDIKALIAANAPVFGIEPQLPDDHVIQAIGGHAGIALTTTRMIAQKGVQAINDDMRDLFRIQDKVLSEALDFDNLKPIQKDALSILSWVPALNAQMLKSIVVGIHGIDDTKFADLVSGLVVACLVRVSGPNYLISSPIRSLFRRKHGYGSDELRTKFAEALKDAWDSAAEDDELRTDLLDSIVYMATLEGGTLDPKFKSLMLPSALQDVVKSAYDRGHNDRKLLARVVELGLPAMTMKMDDATREEILSYVVRAQTRLQDHEGALKTLKFMDDQPYRSRYYLRAFYNRLTRGDLRESVRLLRLARDVKKYRKRVISDLALCLLRLGRWQDLNDLLEEESKLVTEDPVLLDMKIGMHMAKKDYAAARVGIENLRTLRYEDGRAASRSAMLLMREKHDYDGAVAILTEVLEKKTGGQDSVRRLRAIAAALGGKFDLARRDAQALDKLPGGDDTGHLIEARILLEQHRYDEALAELDKVLKPFAQDHLLRARILEVKGGDISIPLSDRQLATRQAQSIRNEYPLVEEFETVS